MTWAAKHVRAVVAAMVALLLSPLTGMVGAVIAEFQRINASSVHLTSEDGLAGLLGESTRRFFVPLVGSVREFRRRWIELLRLL